MRLLIAAAVVLLSADAFAVKLGDHGSIMVMDYTEHNEENRKEPYSLKIELQNEGKTVGKYTTEKLAPHLARTMVLNINMLNRYLDIGGTLDVPSNPTSKDIDKLVRSLEESKDVEVLRKLYRAEKMWAMQETFSLRDSLKACRGEQRAEKKEAVQKQKAQ